MSDTDPLQWEWDTLRQLTQRVHEATEKVDADRVANEEARDKLEERIAASVHKMRWYRRVGVIGLLVGALGCAFGGFGVYEVHKLYDQRRVSRIISCDDANDLAAKINGLGDAVDKVLDSATPPNPNRTIEQQAAIDRFLTDSKAAIAAAHVPPRDCTPDAVARYYQR